MLKTLLNIISTNIVVYISRFSPQNKFIIFLFDFFNEKCSDLIYFIKYNKKIQIINFIKKRQEIESSELVNKYKKQKVDLNLEIILKSLNNVGISDNINIEISQNEIDNFVNQMNCSNFYDSHVPQQNNRKNLNEKPSGAYKSYDYETQLNNSTLLKLCVNEKIVKIAEEYLGVVPKIFSINTFTTLPGQKAFTHNFHRDIDNLKWLVVFIYWTDTSSDDGAFQQIKFTHKPSAKLESILKKDPKIFSSNFDNFFKRSLGYVQSDNYIRLFNDQINSIYGRAGTIVACDTLGLHRGTPVKKNRLVTWIRYGVMKSRQKNLNTAETLSNKVTLSRENMSILNSSKFKDVLSDIVKIN